MHAEPGDGPVGAALVVGGGIGGMQAALDLAESGIKVYLVDSRPSIGGIMCRLDKTFPTNDCAMCTMAPRLVEIARHKDIETLALSEVESVRGGPGDFAVTITRQPRFVKEDRCTGCGACVASCPTHNTPQIEVQEEVRLAPDVHAKVLAIVARHRDREGPLMPILQAVNAGLGYLPQDVLRFLARELGHPLTHLLKLATFYKAFSLVPVGRHVINVCMGTTCYVRGSERLLEKFSEVLGIGPEETTADMNFTLKPLRCIGCCGLAPAVMKGEEVHARLTLKQVPVLVAGWKENGHAGADGHGAA